MLHAIWVWRKTWRTFPILAWIQGAKFYKEGKFDKAAKLYEKGITRHPTHPARYAAQLDLAFCYFRSMEFVKAEVLLQELILDNPNLLEAHILLVRLYLWTGRPVNASSHISLHIRNFSHSAELTTLYLMACIESETNGDLLQEAISFFSKSHSINQVTAGSTLDLLSKTANAMLQYYLGEETESIKTLNQIVGSSCPPVEALLRLAYIYLKQCRYEETLSLLHRALRASPSNPNILLALSRCYLRLRTKDSVLYAVQLATSACQASNWLNNQALWMLTEAYIETGNFIDAALVARKALNDGTDFFKNKRTGIIKSWSTDSSRLDH